MAKKKKKKKTNQIPKRKKRRSYMLPNNKRVKGLGPYGVCRDCKNLEKVPYRDWSRAAGARCTACGGRMDNIAHLHNEEMTARGIYK